MAKTTRRGREVGAAADARSARTCRSPGAAIVRSGPPGRRVRDRAAFHQEQQPVERAAALRRCTRRRFERPLRETGVTDPVAHTSYLINLASPDGVLWEKSIEALAVEVERLRAAGHSRPGRPSRRPHG